MRAGKEASLSDLDRAELQRRELEPYASLADSDESERIAGWFVRYLSLQLQRDGLKKASERLLQEATRADALRRTGGRYGLITMCVGGGIGTATVVERI